MVTIFAAGNIGDDLMLAGFLAAAREAGWLDETTLTCCTPHDCDSQRLRFPEIEWLPYEKKIREGCISECDQWLGLGDTPFQVSVGPWFLDHLCEEVTWSERAGRPMYYLAVGVNEREVLDYPQTHRILSAAKRIWTRDEVSGEILRGVTTDAQKIIDSADLAHLFLKRLSFQEGNKDHVGLVLNFEDANQFNVEDLVRLLQLLAKSGKEPRMLAQEVRTLPGSELDLFRFLSERLPNLAPPRAGIYDMETNAAAFINAWGPIGSLFTTRYHGALIGAWAGWKTVAFPRSEKVRSGAKQLGITVVEAMADTASVARALDLAEPIARDHLNSVAELIRDGCNEFFETVA